MKPIVALSTVAGLALALTLGGFSLADDDEHHARQGYKRPKRIHLVSDYPRTKNGKVIRAQLKRQIEASAHGRSA